MRRCRKVPYAKREDAQRHLDDLKVIEHPSRARHLHIYPCGICVGFLHVGHDYGRVMQRTARRGKHRRHNGLSTPH